MTMKLANIKINIRFYRKENKSLLYQYLGQGSHKKLDWGEKLTIQVLQLLELNL